MIIPLIIVVWGKARQSLNYSKHKKKRDVDVVEIAAARPLFFDGAEDMLRDVDVDIGINDQAVPSVKHDIGHRWCPFLWINSRIWGIRIEYSADFVSKIYNYVLLQKRCIYI